MTEITPTPYKADFKDATRDRWLKPCYVTGLKQGFF